MKKIILLGFISLCLSLSVYANSSPYYGGVAKEVIHAGGYTYILVAEKNAGNFWAAVSGTDVKVGDEVRFQKEFVAKKFHSQELNRDFDELMFASGIEYKVQDKK
ncbi:MAG: hypothetical protein IBX44_07210 [Sulfurospirillum sp.]|nr:hypothetical protein [Sulfurospirillum sp.]